MEKELKRTKMDWMDDIFLGTQESQGLRNAANAVKYTLFGIKDVLPKGMEVKDKYDFISSRRDGRAKAKLLSDIDLIQILCLHAMESFNLMDKNFDISYLELENIQKNGLQHEMSSSYLVELVTYSLKNSVYGTYLLLSLNPYIREGVLDDLIDTRYVSNKRSELDQFDGYLKNGDISIEDKGDVAKAFYQLEDTFLHIKLQDDTYKAFYQEYIQ